MTDLYDRAVTLYLRVYEPHPPPGDQRVVWLRRVIPRAMLKNAYVGRDGRAATQKRLIVPIREGDECRYRPPTWEEGRGFYALPEQERVGFWTVSAGVAPGSGDLFFDGIGPDIDDGFKETAFLSQYPDRAWKVRTVRDNSGADPKVAHVVITD